ncbi:MAG TPA: carbamoyltransferase C-terminal domain-containing protein [Geobacterales bacterium]|nr:carbamoyltransferase C-terminal domain-containing protein [Geobacterales bacterium]
MANNITVLGINDGHDCGAALIRNGKILAAVQEERLSNIKHHSGTPKLAIREVYKIAGIDPKETNAIAIVSLNRVYSPLEEYPLKVRIFEKASRFFHGKSFAKLYVSILHKFRPIKELMEIFSELGIEDKEVRFVEHHLAHASCAYRTSPWGYDKPVLVMTSDGAGDGVSATVNIAEKGEITRIAWSTFYNSLGNAFYSEITRYLGMKPWDHEYKVMGLAPYGKPELCLEKMKKIIRINPKNKLEFENTFGSYLKSMQPKLRKLLAYERFDNIAAACQLYFEMLVCEWVENAIKKTGISHVAFAGGNFLNVKANKRILELESVEDAFFYPACGDDGTPVGAALQAYYEICKEEGIKPEFHPLEDLYYGPSYDDEEIREVLKKEGMLEKAEKYSDINGVVGEMLTKGKIVARFDGRVEWGPRALGNRSILADARDFRVIRKLNSAIKQRDFWMPFAPTILEERIDEYLIDARPARYMILAFDTTEKRDEIIAAIHPQDFTARPQTLNDWNEGYRKILKEFENITGVGGILNTSFNLHGYPIVGTPELAIWTLKNSGLEYLAIGSYLVRK